MGVLCSLTRNNASTLPSHRHHRVKRISDAYRKLQRCIIRCAPRASALAASQHRVALGRDWPVTRRRSQAEYPLERESGIADWRLTLQISHSDPLPIAVTNPQNLLGLPSTVTPEPRAVRSYRNPFLSTIIHCCCTSPSL
jgi:hypothetical protein